MTREEAIQILEINKPVMTKRMSTPARKYVEAFDMAISALKESKGEWIPITYQPVAEEERCCICGGVKRFGICQDCGSDM